MGWRRRWQYNSTGKQETTAMSEFQRIAFRAIDGPVSEKNLDYMHRQSTRAEITPWSFDNEYHFGDFRGNAEEMLRRGYDFHLHYANFGIRKLLLRLPHGLPDVAAARPYLDEEGLRWVKDTKGPGGILAIEPFYEAGELEEIWDLDELLDRLVGLRAEILDGDLRPLYLAHLAVACDGNHDPEETKEGPVPAGLKKLSDAQHALAELYGLSTHFIAAAAQGCPPLPKSGDPGTQYLAWLQGLPQATKDAWLVECMTDPRAGVRRDMVAEFRKYNQAPHWPTVCRDRTIAELHAAATEIEHKATRQAAAKAAAAKARKRAAMAADPVPTLRETEKLVAQRSGDAYDQIATLLAELREALADSRQAGLAEQQAQKLKKSYPTLKLLTSALRRRGFLPK
jgi:hypothetical protein